MNIEENASCNICTRTFRANRGSIQQSNFRRRRNMTSNGNQTVATTTDDSNDNTSNSNNSNGKDIPGMIESQEKFCRNFVAGSTFEKDLNNAGEKTVH